MVAIFVRGLLINIHAQFSFNKDNSFLETKLLFMFR